MFPMLKQKQRWRHLEDGRCGDCYRTAIACYLGMTRDSVPHFVEMHGGSDDWSDGTPVSDAAQQWLNERGMMLIEIPVDGSVKFETLAEDVTRHWLGGMSRLIIGGRSSRGTDHVIVWDREEGYWDTAKDADGTLLVSPQSDGLWWVLAIVPSWEGMSR